jgi:cell volume regulation protein A
MFVARPLAVWLCLTPFRLPRPEVAFVSWVGLRGAVSILLAITPVLGGLEHGRLIFNAAFIVVLVSLVAQGWTVGPLARRLGLIVPARMGPLDKVQLELPGAARHELLAYRIIPGSPVAKGERIPRWARPSLVVRDGRSMRFQDMGRLAAGDYVYIFVPDRYPQLLDKLFASKAAVDPEDADFFGAFAVDPERSAGALDEAYSVGLSEEDRKLTVAALVQERLGGKAEYADRVTIGPVELIVRDVDDKGHIAALGLSFEPTAPVARVPVFLSAGEMFDRIRTAFANWRKKRRRQPQDGPSGAPADSAPRQAREADAPEDPSDTPLGTAA